MTRNPKAKAAVLTLATGSLLSFAVGAVPVHAAGNCNPCAPKMSQKTNPCAMKTPGAAATDKKNPCARKGCCSAKTSKRGAMSGSKKM